VLVLTGSSDPSRALSRRLPSAPLVWMSWQEMQARDPSRDKRGSAKRRSPRASFRGSAAGGGGTGVIGSCSAGACKPRIFGSGAAETVTKMISSNARHLSALPRRKYEPVGAPSSKFFKTQNTRQEMRPVTVATGGRKFARTPRRKVGRLRQRQLQCRASVPYSIS